jgi:hypothetical protein
MSFHCNPEKSEEIRRYFENNFIYLNNRKHKLVIFFLTHIHLQERSTMARQKRGSRILKRAERRAAGMQTISPSLDLGNDLTLPKFWDTINQMRQDLITYNALLSKVDQVYNLIQERERELARLTERMLAATAARYGRDSAEYEMAGGSKRMARRRGTVSSETLVTAPEPAAPVATPPNSEGTAPAMA